MWLITWQFMAAPENIAETTSTNVHTPPHALIHVDTYPPTHSPLGTGGTRQGGCGREQKGEGLGFGPGRRNWNSSSFNSTDANRPLTCTAILSKISVSITLASLGSNSGMSCHPTAVLPSRQWLARTVSQACMGPCMHCTHDHHFWGCTAAWAGLGRQFLLTIGGPLV